MNTNQKNYSEYLALPVGAVIQSPGAFQGEARYVPEFWDITLDGPCYGADGETLEVAIEADDVARYPELAHASVVYLSTDNNGFIYASVV